MLVLTRHRNESIYIGDDVVITVVEIRGDKVRLGVEAPKSVPVHRQEVFEAIQRANKAAEQSAATVDPSSINKMTFLVDGVDRSNGNNKSEVRE